MPAGAAIGAAVIGAGATIYGANQAAKAQTKAAQGATDAQLKMFDITRGTLAPFVTGGANAMGALSKLITPNGGIDQSVLETLPGYQFDLQQGLKANQNSASSRGLGISGAAMKGATRFAEGLADTYAGNWVSRLMGVVNTGANAAAGVGTAATGTGGQIGSNMIGQGNAQAGADMASAGAIGGVGNSYMNYLMMSRLFGGAGGNPAGPFQPGAPIAGSPGMYGNPQGNATYATG